MRILFLTPYPAYPPHGGGLQRMYQFIKGLSEHHEIWCLSLSPSTQASAAAAPLSAFCRLTLVPAPRRGLLKRALQTVSSTLPDMALRAPSSAFQSTLETLLSMSDAPFDVVQAESIEMAQYLAVAASRVPLTVLDQFNAEYVLQRRAALTDLQRTRRLHAGLYSLIQWRKLAHYERRICRAAGRVLVVSEQDRRALRRLDPALSTAIVPNGVDTSYFAPAPGRRDENCLLFTGTMDFRPNVDAVRWFVEQVLPRVRERRPAAYLRIVGRSPAPAVQALARPGAVEVVGEVDDVRDYFRAAGAFVLPMRIGGGVRLKLLEALAMELPLVSTSMGAEGVEGLRSQEHCLLADDPAAFASAVLRVLEDRALASALSAAGRRLVQARYDWGAVVPLLEEVYTRREG